MNRVRFIMIGGFLGAGKTTAIARLARHYMDQGQKVGLVTNDQAYNLVDTQSLRAQGFEVGEVPGACFCCKFDDLIETASKLKTENAPEIIIAEPVGSCTDLAATVIEPMRHLYQDSYEVGPLAVLLKPEHGQKILRQQQGLGFSPKAAYIFLKQIEEADVVVINKIDKLSEQEQQELVKLVGERYPGKKIIAASALQGDGFDQLISAIEAPAAEDRQIMEVDYDVYAAGEAELGWLNCQVQLQSGPEENFDLDDFLLQLLSSLRDALIEADAEPAHLKVLGQSSGVSSIANLVGSEAEVELSLASETQVGDAILVVNARVAVDPERLEQIVVDTVGETARSNHLSHSIEGMQRFRPGRPTPTHRMGSQS